MDKPKIYIADLGMITPVGFNAQMTTASVKAGIASINEVEFYDHDYNAVRMSTVPDEALETAVDATEVIMPLTARQYRLLQLSTLAISGIDALLPKDHMVPVFLAGPQNILEKEPSIDKHFLDNLAEQSNINIDLESSRCITTGRAGGLDIIDTAFKYFETSRAQFVIVGGVDTYYDKAIINYYVEQQRILTMESMDGFIPGEGAGFLLLVSEQAPDSIIKKCKSYMTLPGSGFEEGYIGSLEPYTGSGLSTAIQNTFATSEIEGIKFIMSSMNGENYFAKELGVAITRNRSNISDNFTVQHIAEYCGDMGAAIGPVMIGILHNRNSVKQPPGLVYCSSDSGFRSAVCVDTNS